MIRTIAVFTVLLSFAINIYADNGKASVSRHRCRDLKGNDMWDATETVVPVAGQTGHYLLTEKEKGAHGGFDGITTYRSQLEFIEEKERLAPLRMKKQVLSADGKIVLEETQEFNLDKGRVECKVKDIQGGKEKKTLLKYKGDVINSLIMDNYISRFLDAGKKEKAAYFVSDDGSLYRLTLKVVAEEEITVNGKKYRAYKICVDPDIGLLSPVKAFIPKNYDWYSCEPPYEWLKFRGLESSIDSPVVEITAREAYE